MKLGRRKAKDEEEVEEEVKPSRKKKEKKVEEPKDPYRWVSFLLLLIFIFVAFLFWADK